MKLLFFDIDGTIFWNGRVSASVVTAMKTVQAAGNRLIINTGRSYSFIPGEVKTCFDWDGFICGTGHVTLGEETLCNRVFSLEALSALYDYCAKKGYIGHFEGESVTYVFCPDARSREIFKARTRHENSIICQKLRREDITERYGELRITKVAVLGHVAPDESAHFPGVYALDFGDYAEVYCDGFTKATGMELIGRRLGLNREDMIAFGDSLNDIEMIRYAGTGAVMDHAPEELLKYAAARMKSSPDGVAECLRELFPQLF